MRVNICICTCEPLICQCGSTCCEGVGEPISLEIGLVIFWSVYGVALDCVKVWIVVPSGFGLCWYTGVVNERGECGLACVVVCD